MLRHPVLANPPTSSLPTLHSLLSTLPYLSTSSHTTSPSRPLPWSFPTSIELILKSHPHRGTRLIAWRLLRLWYNLHSRTGHSLRDQWVWSSSTGALAPLPTYPADIAAEFEHRFGPNPTGEDSQDLIEGWSQELLGEARIVDGGVELFIRARNVDAWVLPVVEAARAREERARLSCEDVCPAGWTTDEEKAALAAWTGLGPVEKAELGSTVVSVEGFLIFREGLIPSSVLSAATQVAASNSLLAPTTVKAQPETFVPTPSTSQLTRTLALHLQRRLPVLITSPPSSGKSSVLNHLWSVVHASSTSATATSQARKRGLVVINLADRSLDSKSLLGSLSSAPTTSDSAAGTFTFVEGPLTRAVRQGRWVVLASIDQASLEVLSVIKVLTERMSHASEAAVGGAWGGGTGEESGGVGVRVGGGSGRWVAAGKGFMLFATRSVESSISGTAPEVSFFASQFFSEVHLARPNRDEIALIVQGRYERLGKTGLAATLIEVWEQVNGVAVKDGTAGTARPNGVRDLMRWCRRVEGLLPRDVEIRSIEANPVLQEEIFTEARDVFLGSMPLPPTFSLDQPRDRYSVVSSVLAGGLHLSAERAEWVLRKRVPEMHLPRIDEDDGLHSTAELALNIGRVALPYRPNRKLKTVGRPYALTRPSLIVLEKLAVCLRLSEPVLMVGETGTGKTAAVGHLAELLGKRLTALNLSNQTEAGDLVGGFRPIDEVEEGRRTASELVNRFVDLFGKTFSLARNAEYVSHVKKAYDKKRWPRLVGLWREANRMATDRIGTVEAPITPPAAPAAPADAPRKRRKVEKKAENLPLAWREFLGSVAEFDTRFVQKAGKSKFVFSFVEGPLAKAIRDGDWVLLDEVNLASAETLESLSTLLATPDSSLILTEQGDLEPIPRHPDFRLFACMNPATDVGKRDLPAALRAKFSEIWVPPPDEDRDALVTIVHGYLGSSAVQDKAVIGNVADLYQAVKALAQSGQLADGTGQPPHFSMRTLARALVFAAEFANLYGLRRSLRDGFLMSFTMLLDQRSQKMVEPLLVEHLESKAKNRNSLFHRNKIPPKPTEFETVQFGPYWVKTGEEPVLIPGEDQYVVTPSVEEKLHNLARAVLARKVPVLIQGPTSAGKTSVVEYLAQRTGHRFVRINNHEHTDIQEYIGTYVSDSTSGKLVFQEGVLVRALRRGDWIVLDELNLAPTDVLEALNRLLDDNRELVIPETGEVVRPHPHFMLFATQNPPGLYGGRKVLSRAFRNRFLEMHFDDVPEKELELILQKRCGIAPSYAKQTVKVFNELQLRRSAGGVFDTKQGFATLRDLFRWGGRGSVGYQQLAEDGYMLLAERARRADDKAVVKEVIEQVMRVTIDPTSLYQFDKLAEAGLPVPPADQDLVWTNAMRRLYFLIAAGLHRNEPVLLVGETGAGKTSVCQALALAVSRQLHIVGCHQNTETADLLGGQRPLRNRAALQAGLTTEAIALLQTVPDQAVPDPSGDFEELIATLEALIKFEVDVPAGLGELIERMRRTTALFEWHDGPLVQAMHGGDLILLDEISLADDSVLERLNSVLEPSRTLVLAEKSGRDLEDIQIKGAEGFQILATMNPGGDFGKKELSPALRNRFTEIWVPSVDDREDLLQIIGSRWASKELLPLGEIILAFGTWLGQAIGVKDGMGIGLRDILGWVDFLNKSYSRIAGDTLTDNVVAQINLGDAFCQGALMTVVDGLGALPATSGLSPEALAKLKASCWRQLESLVQTSIAPEDLPLDVVDIAGQFFVGPFGVGKGELPAQSVEYTLLAPTTRLNAMRLLRALQLKKPVLLEGSPGVGKTSLVTAMAAATGHALVRINLSDQTDLMDLLGSDLPVEGGKSGEFAWKDAPFLAAMQNGEWVLLDEMNLASQSILEGLNSSLDHRGEVYIPELDRTFRRHPEFRIFAAQNPLGQGGGRKGLPRSFLDRFSVVHMEELNPTDLNAIAAALYPEMDTGLLARMIAFNTKIHHQTMNSRAFGMEGSPWEFNLRDVLRWLSLVRKSTGLDQRRGEPVEYVGLLYLQRFRNISDRAHVAKLFAEAFDELIDPAVRPWPSVGPVYGQVGHSLLVRDDSSLGARQLCAAPLLQRSLQPLEALTKTLEMGWLAILTGPKSCGKTTLVRQLATVSGQHLQEFSMNAEVDTLELLGSFEQAERFRELDRLAAEAQVLVQAALAAQLGSKGSSDLHVSLVILRQLRLELSIGAADYDLAVGAQAIQVAVQPLGATEVVTSLLSRVEIAANAGPIQARFEWIDGPLVTAMKKGDWLLIEDANLCSPSVLDRLNSLFETGGRLQLAERGPVDGEIQIIEPHPNFRLVMTLDPRNGELSRAMRNRGIEIAIIQEEGVDTDEDNTTISIAARTARDGAIAATEALQGLKAKEAESPLQQTAFLADTLNEPGLAPIVALASLAERNPELDLTALAKHLVATTAKPHFGLAIRFLRTINLLDSEVVEACVRALEQHGLISQIEQSQAQLAAERGIPAGLVGLQPVDLSLGPGGARLSSHGLALSDSLDGLLGLLLAPASQPNNVRAVAAKPTKSLTVWDKSLLSAHGKLRLDEADPALLSVFPVRAALGDVVSALVSVPLGSLEADEQLALAKAARTIQSLAAELEVVCETSEIDFSSIQHVAKWITAALALLPASTVALVETAEAQLNPLRSSIALSSGKAMTQIWRGCLPFQPANPKVAAAYERLMDRASQSVGEVWDKGVVALFLDVVVALGVPQVTHSSEYEEGAVQVIEQILLRLPKLLAASTDEHDSLALTVKSNAASLGVAELAAVAASFGSTEHSLAASILVQVAQRSGVVPLSSVVPLHQLGSWPGSDLPAIVRAKASAEFQTLAAWAEHAALGVGKLESGTHVLPTTAADIVRPSLLKAVVSMRATDSSNLENLVVLSEALGRAAGLQAATAAADAGSRVESLGAALKASIKLLVSCASADSEDPAPTDLVSTERQLIPELAEAVDLHLAGVLPALNSATPTLEAVGHGFVAFARCLWFLYVPNLPIDPAIGLRAHSGFLGRQLAVLSQTFVVVHQAEVALTGNKTNPKLASLGLEIDALQRELDGAGVVPVTRQGNPALLAALFQELKSFHQQIVSDLQLTTLLDELAQPWSDNLANRESNLQHSIGTLLRRLTLAYSELDDILGPVRLALCAFKIGFSLLHHVAKSAAIGVSSSHFAALLTHLASFPTVAHAHAIERVDLPLSIKVGEAPLAPARATLLQVTALTTRLGQQDVFDRSALRRLTQLYDRLHYLWSADVKHAEEAAAEAASMYKSKANNDEQKTDEELEAQEFAALFPSFEELDEEGRLAEKKEAANSTATSTPMLLKPEDQVTLARMHVRLFANEPAAFADPTAREFEAMRSSSVQTLLPGLFDSLDEGLDRSSAAFRVRTLVELSQATAPSKLVDPPQRDFYNEADVRETAKVVPLLLGLAARLRELIDTWPDQMVLQNLLQRCETVLSLSSKSPIAQVLTAIEQLLQHTEDWESYASREHSISVHRTALTNQIVEWRRLELTCWSRLLSTVVTKFDQSVAEWWFRFYEVTIRGAPGVDVSEDEAEAEMDEPVQSPGEYYRELVALLDNFMAKSSLGQYGARLELVLSFANLAAKLGQPSNDHFDAMDGAASLRQVSQLMHNVYAFYNQFTPKISAFLATERKRIEKEVADLIKLASWKDVNVYALKMSAIKSHHMLYKSVRKLRAVLQKPASDFFTADKTDKGPALALVRAPMSQAGAPAVALPALPAELVSATESQHLVLLDKTYTRLAYLVGTQLDPFVTFDRATLVDELAVEIITTSAQLKSESGPGEEEGRESRVKALATRKRRAWIELLRELKRVGLSPRPAPEIVAKLQDSGVVYGLPASHALLDVDGDLLPDELQSQLKKADAYHFRLLAELPALRVCPAEHSPDVSTREVQLAIGSIESGINMGFEHRSLLLGALTGQLRLKGLVNRIAVVGQTAEQQPVEKARVLAEALRERVSQFVAGLTETLTGLGHHRVALGVEAANADVVVVEGAVREAIGLLEADQTRLNDVLAGMGSNEFVLSTPSEAQVFDRAREHLVAVVDKLTAFECPAGLHYLIGPLAQWAASADIPLVWAESAEAGVAVPLAELADLKNSHSTLVSSILVVAQELKKLADADAAIRGAAIEDVPDLVIKQSGRTLQDTLAVLRVHDLVAQLDGFARKAHALSAWSDQTRATVSVLLRRVEPFVAQVGELMARQLASFLEWHKAGLKLAYVLSQLVQQLAKEGFCKPQEDDGKEGQETGDAQQSDGTGMAAGQGAKNVSNEIEDESQIEGLEGDVEEEKDKNEKEEDDNDDAVEMSNDFEGEMEDRGDGEDNEKEEGEEEEDDQPDPEEQIADVDPLDPSSVDEKFWGDENKEEQEGKGNEEVNQETKQDQGEAEMAAKDEGAPKPQPKDDKEKEQDVNPDEKDDGEKPNADDEGKQLPDEGQEEGEEGEPEGEQEGEMDENEGEDQPPAQEDGERLDQRLPEADNLDLPDDMQLDGDDKEKEEDNFDLDDDMDDLPEDEGDENQADQLDDRSEGDQDEMHENDDQDALANENETNLEGEAPEQPEQDEAPLDQSLGGAEDGQTGGEGAQDNASAAKPEPSAAAEKSQSSGAQADLKDEVTEEDQSADDVTGEKEDDEMDDDQDVAPSAPSASADGASKQKQSAADPKSDPSKQKPNQSQEAQQQRSLGDTLQSWRRRLEEIQDQAEAEATQAEDEPEEAGAKGDQDGEVEFVQEGDEQEGDEQALGPASEEQLKNLEKLQLGDEEPQTEFEPDQMEVDKDDQQGPTVPEPSKAINIGGSSLEESDAKAIPAQELRDDRTRAEEDHADIELEREDEAAEAPSTTRRETVDPELDAEVEEKMLQWRAGEDESMTAEGVWRLYESLTRDLSYSLTEQLRLILEPTLATRLKGDYRSGKRLNMKKIIPYIASEFTKDKIWLRRTRPSQREYQILIAIDDSKSMADSHSVHLAYQTLALISRALARLEVGGISIARFGSETEVLHPFEDGAISDQKGADLLGQFSFAQKTTDVRLLVERSLQHLALAKDAAQSGKSSLAAGDLWQLQIIISDGMCQDHDKLRALLRKAVEQKVMFVFVVIDSLHRRDEAGAAGAAADPAGANQNSILAMQSVSYTQGPNGLELKMDRYLDSFPFEYFVVLRDVEALPEVLSATLRQFFERVSSQ